MTFTYELVGSELVEQLVNALVFSVVTKGRVIAASIVAKFVPHAKTTSSLLVTIADTAAVLAKLCAALGLQVFLALGLSSFTASGLQVFQSKTLI